MKNAGLGLLIVLFLVGTGCRPDTPDGPAPGTNGPGPQADDGVLEDASGAAVSDQGTENGADTTDDDGTETTGVDTDGAADTTDENGTETTGADPDGAADTTAVSAKGTTFGDDVAFLGEHTDIMILIDDTGEAQVAIAPAYQGRIMTSTADGDEGLSFGWINRELISSGKFEEHINVFGGEDRFWLGPEGGQFSIFFAKDVPFDLEHWFTPAPIDTESFEFVGGGDGRADFRRDMQLTNYSGTVFDLRVDRAIQLLAKDAALKMLGPAPTDGVKLVAFESINKITNTGKQPWEKETGLLSVWILGMFTPSEGTTVVVPYVDGSEEDLGPIVNDAYFGKVPGDRLVARDGTVYFSGDGTYRSKIGLSPGRSKTALGSYDSKNHVLTIVQYNKPDSATDYVNSMWELQKEPYAGDVVNSYNDGPPEPGKDPLGPFYELETSSPAAALGPDESITHVHRTFHLQGPEEQLSAIAKNVLGVTTDQIKQGLTQ
jgi:hypothetical protein